MRNRRAKERERQVNLQRYTSWRDVIADGQ
jgi:hypothetical protein